MKSQMLLFKPGRYMSTQMDMFTLVEVRSSIFSNGSVILAFNTQLYQEIVKSRGGVIIQWENDKPSIFWQGGNGKQRLLSPSVYLIEVIQQNLSNGGRD